METYYGVCKHSHISGKVIFLKSFYREDISFFFLQIAVFFVVP
jgi:hypothetical protein